MKVVLQQVLAGRKTMTLMTKRRQRDTPEQIVRKIQAADRILAQGDDVAALLRELNITEATY
jgi:putative transposase